MKINSKKALLESMADNGGLRGAYRAWLRHQEHDKTLPGLHYTKNQLFWIGAARGLCENRDPNYEKSMFNTLPNPAGKLRVNGLMSNIPEFAEDFHCSPDTP
ncbi:Endothelin-converting enzyme 1, partial [Stegodyphus mimosarum]